MFKILLAHGPQVGNHWFTFISLFSMTFTLVCFLKFCLLFYTCEFCFVAGEKINGTQTKTGEEAWGERTGRKERENTESERREWESPQGLFRGFRNTTSRDRSPPDQLILFATLSQTLLLGLYRISIPGISGGYLGDIWYPYGGGISGIRIGQI